jgi:uncharacterized protein
VTDDSSFAPPLNIGVISDTHIHERTHRIIPPQVFALFRRAGVGLILHAGDINVPAVLSQLSEIAPVIAVAGNNDVWDLQVSLPQVARFTIGKFRFALVHGHQAKTARVAARQLAGSCDCVVYGHSHIPRMEEIDGTVLFNPGSATDRRWGPHFGIGLISVTEEHCRPDLILFSEPGQLDELAVARPGQAG